MRTVLLSLSVALSGVAHATTVDATLVAETGTIPAGSIVAITSMNAPDVGTGGACFTGGDASGHYMFADGQVVWQSADGLPLVLAGAESSSGCGATGQFLYSPAVDGNDAVWTHNGLLLAKTMPAPGYPAPATSTFNSRPVMTLGGIAYWVGGIDLTGGTTSQERALFRQDTTTNGPITIVRQGNDLIDGQTLTASGIGFDFHVSDNDQHLCQEVTLDTGSTTDDGAMVLDGLIAVREGDPIDTVENWDNFDLCHVADDGTWALTGDTDGSTTADEFLAINGTIVFREGDTIDGITLGTSAVIRFISFGGPGVLAHAWSEGSGTEHVFATCDTASPATSTRLVLSTGDDIDLDGDGLGDAVVTDLNTSTTTNADPMGTDGTIYLEVDLDRAGVSSEAIIAVDSGCCPDADGDTICDADDFFLAATPVVPGSPMTVSVTNAGANDPVRFYVTRSAATPAAPCLPSGLCGSLGSPRFEIGTVLANAAGEASVTLTVPNGLAVGTDLRFQAFTWDGVLGAVSQVVEAEVVP